MQTEHLNVLNDCRLHVDGLNFIFRQLFISLRITHNSRMIAVVRQIVHILTILLKRPLNVPYEALFRKILQ